jgi:hypothetical protein
VPITLERTPHQQQVFCKALIESGHSVSSAAKLTHLSRNTVAEIRDRTDYDLASIQQIQKRLPAKFYITADWAINNLTADKLESCSAPQLMMVAGIAVDKARDMEGNNRPVINIVELSMSMSKAISESKARQQAIETALVGMKGNIT